MRYISVFFLILVFTSPAYGSFPPKVKVYIDGKYREVDLEEYVKGVVFGELPDGWPDEAIKAQAVVSRSYVLYVLQNERRYVVAGPENQVFKYRWTSRISNLVDETRGWVLTFPNGSIAPGFFHSTCGGSTESAWELWGRNPDFKYIVSVNCGKCYDSPHFFWKVKMRIRDIMNFGKILTDTTAKLIFSRNNWNKITRDVYLEKTEHGRVISIIFPEDGIFLDYYDIRKFLKSNFLDVEVVGDGNIIFYGRGFGHGVGMCQWGAKKLAEEGASWKEILKFYFPLLKFKRIY